MSDRRTVSSADPVTQATERMLGLSDALFGIAITFLALDFGSEVPTSVDKVDGYLLDNITGYLAYVFAFLVVGFQWWRHHWVFRFIKQRNNTLLLLNTTLLAFVALTPFGTEVLGHGIGSPVNLTFFAGLMFCIGTMLWGIWEYAVRHGLTIPDLDRDLVLNMRVRLMVMPGSFLLIMISAMVAGMIGWEHDLIGLVLLMVLLCWAASRRFRPPSVGIIEREIETAMASDRDGIARGMVSRLMDGARSERLTVFTDGVFAVAFTILALRLAPPQDALRSESDLMSMLSANSGALIAYFITFYVLSEQWMRHVRLFDREVFADTRMMWLNLVFLMFVAFMPFATELTTQPGGRTAILLYLSVLSAATLTQMVMEIQGRRQTSRDSLPEDPASMRNTRARRIGVILILIVASTLGLTMPVPETGLYALVLFTVLGPVCSLLVPSAKTA
ncbi:MAG: hypothetical protein CMJ34_11355 [Phycisphaerae bacterium]|nr:hypothetical protein [Phycisphaerae bacterium]